MEVGVVYDVDESWGRIMAWYKANVAALTRPFLDALPSGATSQELDETESSIGIKLPEAVRKSYRVRNGEPQFFGSFPQGMLLNLDDLVAKWRMRRRILDEGDEVEPEDITCSRQIRRVGWDAKWIPFTDNGSGNPLCIDMHPARHGTLGQIFRYDNNRGPTEILAVSMDAFLYSFANDLENGAYAWNGDALQVQRIQR